MCVVILVYRSHGRFPLIILHGRDEVLSRATEPPAVLRPSNVLCGVDGEKRGTWCGVNVATGNAVFLTNWRTHDLQPAKYSRGTLVMDLLEGHDPWDGGSRSRHEFGPHNVIRCNVFDPDVPVLYETSVDGHDRVLEPGVYALSNSTLDDLTWPKVKWLKEQATRVIEEMQDSTDAMELLDALGALLMNADRHPYSDETLIPKQPEERVLRQLIFLHNLGRDYGTRCQSGVVARLDGTALYVYREIDLGSGQSLPWSQWELKRPGAPL